MKGRAICLAPPVLWSLYFLWRAPAWPWFSGVPLTPLSTGALAAVWWLWAMRRRLPFVRIVAVLAIAKLLVSAAVLDRGLRASYYANPAWQGPPERGLYIRDGSATELDKRLSFGMPGTRDLPLFFFNDSIHYNYYQRGQPDVGYLAYSVAWTGYLQVDRSNARLDIYLRGPGVTAQADVEGFEVARLTPQDADATGSVTLKPGSRAISIRLSGAYAAPRRFEAGFIDPATGAHRPFDDEAVIAVAARPWRLRADRVARVAAYGLDLTAGATLIVTAFLVFSALGPVGVRDWRRLALAAGSAFALAEALWFLRFFHDHLILFGGGDDWLTYETFARDIALHGPMMTLGHPIGHADPFYFQALYPYFLALTHLVWGESLWGAFFLQRLFQTVTVFTVSWIADLLFGGAAAIGTFAVATWFALAEIDSLTRIFLSENLFIPLAAVWTALVCRMAIRRPARPPMGAAIAGGLATLTRSTLLLAWVPVLAVLTFEYRRRRQSLQAVAGFALAACLVIGVATARNWIASRQFVFVTSSFGAMFRIGNQPPAGLPRHDPAVRRILERVSHDPNVVDTLEFAVEAPGKFLDGLGRKAAYTLGWFPALDPVIFKEGDPKLMFTWMLALAGLAIWVIRRAPPSHDSPLAGWIPFLVAFTHFASVVLIVPSTYVRRMILPLYVLLLPYTGLALSAVIGWMTPRHRRAGRGGELAAAPSAIQGGADESRSEVSSRADQPHAGCRSRSRVPATRSRAAATGDRARRGSLHALRPHDSCWRIGAVDQQGH